LKIAGGEPCPCQTRRAKERKAAADARRPSASARGYGAKWQEVRAAFLSVHTKCGCGEPATVVDHEKPHKGDFKLFWDRKNWSAKCARCHNRKTAKHDGGFGRRVTCV
jgi:5-methylcytosine-specific restriction endonuclease McrA